MDNFLTVIITVISGVLVYVLSELFTEFILKPIRDYKELKGKVAKQLVLYACYISNPLKINKVDDITDNWKNVSEKIRELAAEIAALAETRPLSFGVIPKKKKLKEASKELIGISNSLWKYSDTFQAGIDNVSATKKVKKLLKIEKDAKKGKGEK